MIDREYIIKEIINHTGINGDININNSVASRVEHTLLNPEATKEDIKILCDEAKFYGFYGVCIQPYWVKFAHTLLRNTNVKLVTVCGFPDGTQRSEVKTQEARLAVLDGADEVDMVMNIGAFKSKDYDNVVQDIKMVKNAIRPLIKLKVIIETPLLSEEEIVKAALLVEESGANFVKTGTGRNGPVKVRDVELIKKAVKIPIKAAGGIREKELALQLIRAGAERIGTSSGPKVAGE